MLTFSKILAKNGKEYYYLDPAHYFSCPGVAWDAMLLMTYINLELISGTDMYQMVEKGLRGGLGYTASRYSKPNNKCLSDYDKYMIVSFLMYLDANNLYSYAMSQPLPKSGLNGKKKINGMIYLKIKKELDILLNVIWSIQKNYMIYIMITPLPLKI